MRRVVASHLRFARPGLEEALNYNVLQRIIYLAVIFGLFPLLIWTGLAMSPVFTPVFPTLVNSSWRPPERTYDPLLRSDCLGSLCSLVHCDGLVRGLSAARRIHNHGTHVSPKGGRVSNFLSRRKLLTAGLATAGGAVGLSAAARLADRYGLIPPDWGGVWGLGETLTHACQRAIVSSIPWPVNSTEAMCPKWLR